MYFHKFKLSTFLLVLSAISLFAQNSYNLRQFIDETGDFATQPLKWQAKDFLTLGAIIGGTYGLMHLDETIRRQMLKDTSWRGSIPLELGRYWGEPATPLLIGSGLMIIGANHENNSSMKLGFEILQAFSYSVAINGALKILIGRARPSTGKDAFTFKPAQSLQNKFWSLPSGHTTVAFSLSTVLAENTESTGLKVLAYMPAFVTALSRVNYNRHWLSDVFLGGFSGYIIAKYVTKLHKQEKSPALNNQTPLISFSMQF